jgi:S-adenosyl methyltransferase
MPEQTSKRLQDEAQDEAGLDTRHAHSARVYNYWLGGKDNFAADREAAEQAIAANPGIVRDVRADRAFLVRVVRYLAADCGVRQFLDIGTGRPSPDSSTGSSCSSRASSSPRAGVPSRAWPGRPRSRPGAGSPGSHSQVPEGRAWRVRPAVPGRRDALWAQSSAALGLAPQGATTNITDEPDHLLESYCIYSQYSPNVSW